MKASWMTMPLAFVATLAFLFAVGTSGAGPDVDTDGDGVQDNIDNCTLNQNADQVDSNKDGYGNNCDADYTNDGVIGGPDIGVLLAAYKAVKANNDVNYNPDVDCNDDEVIGGPDLGCFLSQYLGNPGPEGRGCGNVATVPAGPTVRCPASNLPL